MISFELSSDLDLFRQTARDFALAALRPRNREAEDARAIPRVLEAQYLDLGLAAVELPEALGGLGLGLVARAVVEEQLAYGDLGIALGMPAPGALATAVLLLGTRAQAERLIPDLLSRRRRGAIAWTEPKPKARTFSTIADEQPDGRFRLNGAKTEIVGADEAGAAIVFAEARRKDGRVHPAAFHVVLNPEADRAKGLRFGGRSDGLGLNAAPVVDLTLEDVFLSPDARLSGADDRFEGKVVEMFTRVGLVGASRAVGLAQAAFDFASDYAQGREAFGKPIAHFQGLAFLIADMATRVTVMRTMVQRAAWGFDANEEDAPKLAAMAIAECHEGAMFVTNNAVQVLGGAGFIQDYPVEKWMRDAKAHMAYAMPHQLCDLLVGRLGLEGSALSMIEDAPMPEMQPVLI
jgi:alkylation response protein AidB-like acyl-CoA dehydrogenase